MLAEEGARRGEERIHPRRIAVDQDLVRAAPLWAEVARKQKTGRRSDSGPMPEWKVRGSNRRGHRKGRPPTGAVGSNQEIMFITCLRPLRVPSVPNARPFGVRREPAIDADKHAW